MKNCINKIIDTYGRIDAVVNCAGIVFDRNMYEATISEFENTIRVNVFGAFIVSMVFIFFYLVISKTFIVVS